MLEWRWSEVNFPYFMALIIQFIWLIERILSPYAMSTNGLKSFRLFSALTSTLMKSWTSVIVLTGGGGGDRRGLAALTAKQLIGLASPQRRTVREQLSPHFFHATSLISTVSEIKCPVHLIPITPSKYFIKIICLTLSIPSDSL